MFSSCLITLFLTTIFLLQHNSIKAIPFEVFFEPSKLYSFASDLLPLIIGNKSSQNVVYSPASMYTSLSFAYLGAKHRTADELNTVLKLDKEDRKHFASQFGKFLKTKLIKTYLGGKGPQPSMSNRFFVSKNIQLLEKFNEIAHENFDSIAESVDYSQASTVVEKINKWVEKQTKSKIKNLIQPNAVKVDTSAILVNAIYFKASCLHPFSKRTFKWDFFISRSKSVLVDTMYVRNTFGYANLPDLQAEALQLPFSDSDISMLIIFPKDIEGLKKLEERLIEKDLKEIASKITKQELQVFLSKFRIEFEIDLKEPLEKLNCSTMFSYEANFNGMFDSIVPHRISEVKQKAFLEINQYGAEAIAATYPLFELLSAPEEKLFVSIVHFSLP